MSDIKKGVQYGNHTTEQAKPRALIHKKILDAARAHPEASIEDLAEEVCGASAHLVERVLDEYGDPVEVGADAKSHEGQNVGKNNQQSMVAIDQPNNQNMDEDKQNDTTVSRDENEGSDNTSIEETNDSGDSPTESTDTGGEGIDAEYTNTDETGTSDPISGEDPESTVEQTSSSSDQTDTTIHTTNPSYGNSDRVDGEMKGPPSPNELSEKQLEVLREVHDRPHATQAELAEEFNVSRATISQRVNAIEGFEWSERQQFVNAVFNGSVPISDGNGGSESVDQILDHLDDLTDRIETFENRLEGESNSSAFDDPELATAVVRACIDSDHVTEDQEEQIIIELMDK